MTDHPRQQLHYIITHYGRSICDDTKRCEALLKDLCPQHKREVNLLVAALREGIVKELLKSNQLLPIEATITHLSQKLHDELGFDSSLAQWALESWAFVLGITFNSSAMAPSHDKGKAEMGAQQIATPIAPVNQPSQAIIDQFKGWQKIGLQGEKLAVDAPQWAAMIDKKTNLMWAVNPSQTANFPNPSQELAWDKTQVWVNHVNRAEWCGYDDWRLPTIEELKTLLLPNKHTSLYIREDVFTDIATCDYWAWSSSSVAFGFSVCIINFKEGYVDYALKSLTTFIRLVRYV